MLGIKPYLSKLFNIYEEDWKPLLTLQLFIVCICAVIANLKTVSNALFVANIGAKNLPFTYIGCAATLIVSGMVLIPIIDKLQRHRVYIITVVSLSVFVLFSYVMIRLNHKWIYYFLYIASYIMDTILFLEFWLIASDLCDARQSKRIFPLIIGWSLVGGIIGAFGTKFLVNYFKTSELLLFSAAALASTIFVIMLIKFIFPKEIAFQVKGQKKSSITKLQRIKMDVDILKGSPLLKYICFSFILYSFLIYLLDFQFNMAASAHFTVNGKIQIEQLTAFYGMFDGICISAALLFQFFIAQRFLAAFGVANSQLILPSVLAMGFSSIMVNLFGIKGGSIQPFFSTILTRLGQKVSSSSIYRLSYNLLYNPISKEKRGRSKTFSESLVQPIGVLLVGVSILFLKDLNLIIICGLSLVITVIYIFNTLKLKKAYIQSVLSIFDAKDYSQIESFAGLFGKLGEKEIFKKLYQAMGDKDFNIRCFIVDIIGEINNSGAAVPLVDIYHKEENPRVKASIIKVLGKLGGNKAKTIIKEAVNDPESRIRANSIETIELIKMSDFYPDIVRMLKDPNHRVKANAAIAVFSLDLKKHKEEAVNCLLSMFDKGSAENKVSSLYAFGEINNVEFIKYIIKGTESPDIRIQQRAILSLGKIKFEKSADMLINILRTSTNSMIKNAVTQSLISLGKTSINAILSELNSPDVYERKYLIKALSSLSDKRFRPTLLSVAGQEIESIKQNTYYAELLETIPQKESVLILIDSLKDQVNEGKENVLNILAILCGNTQSIKTIIKNIHHQNRFYRANALEALEQIGEKEIVKEIIPVIESAYTTRIPPLQYNENKCNKTVCDLLKSNFSWTRSCALFALGKLKAITYKNEVLRLINDPYDIVRATAIETIKAFNDKADLQHIRSALKDPSELVRNYAKAALGTN